MAQESSSTSKLTIDVTCTPRNRANLRRLKTTSIQSFQRWEKENELLYAMIEDESAWLSSLFPDAFITPELFFYALEDGVILCLLANFIQEMAEDFGTRIGKSVPGKKVTFHKSKKGSRESKLFYSRENVDKFLTWCRWHGIPEAILFESNDAVLVDECRTGGREIVICLMEIARRSSQYEIEVPQMIKLEREIEEEELSDTYGEEEHGLALEIESRGDKSPIDSDSGVESVFEEGDPGSPRLSEFATDETEPVNQSMKKFEEEKKLRVTQKDESVSLLESSQPKTELDKKVCKIAQEYNIKIVHRLKEGKYIILGKTMFVRMLNEHLLVRIGGGWDTLEHYVMTHASKSTEGSATTHPSSSNRKSSGVWSKLVDKVRRRESQPNIKESPVVISKRQRPDSSPSVYRLRDRVKKKLSVTEKDEKDISDAIRKIESSVTVKSPHSSPSFTSKTFFQLKSRFDKGRKSSRENVFDSNERKRMADQTVETITDEHPKETEPKQEETGTTMLLEFDTSQGRTEEHTTSTATVTDYSSNEFMYSQKQVAESSSADDVLLFNQQVQQSSWQSFSTNDPNDLLSLENPPLFSSESLHPQQASEEKQAEIHNGDEEESRVEILSSPDQEAAKSATDITAEITQEVETTPTGVSAEETAEAPSTLETEPIPDIEERGLQESPEGEQADFGNVSGEADVINVSSSFESAPQDNVLPEPCYGEQYKEASDELLVSVEQTGTISFETKEEDELSSQLTIVTSSEMETEETTVFQDGMMTVPSDTNAVSKEQEKPEDEIPSQSTVEISQDVSVEKEKFSASAVVESENTLHEDKQVDEEELEGVYPPTQMTCDTAMEDNEFIALDKEKDDEVQVTEAIPSDVQADEKEEPEAAGGDGVMPLPLDADAFNKEQEKPEISEIPSQLTEELSQDVSVEQEKFPGSAVVESENTHPEDKQVDEEELEGDNPPTQMTFEDLRSSDTAVEDMEFVALDKEKDDEVQVTEAIPSDVQADEKEEPEAANGDGVMPLPLDADAFNKEQEKPEEDKLPSQITDELSQDASVEQEKFPASAVVESENTPHEEKQEEELKDKIVGSPTEEAERLPFAEQPTAEQQKVEQKEANHTLPDTSSAAVNHKKATKKPVTTKKENVKAAGGSTSKTLLARKKETQKAERPKESAVKPSTRTTKPTSAKAAPKTKPLSAVPGARPTSTTKRPLSAQTQKPGIDARPVTTTRTTPKTTTKLNESKRPSSTTTTKSSTVKDKQPLAPGEKQKSKSTESRSRSAALTKATDRKDGKPAASSRPLSTKTIPLPATTKTAVKKTTTTTTVKSANGSTSKTEVSKTTTTAGRGGATKTKTTVRKTTESGGKPKASEGTLHPTASARNNIREKPGSRPPSATTKGKPGSNAVAKGKTTSERPKSPTKGAAKKSAPSKEKVTTSVSPPAAAEPPTISSLKQEAPDSSTPDVTADSKESVTRVIEYTEVMEADGDIKVLQTKVLTETVSENGHEQTVTEETVVGESG